MADGQSFSLDPMYAPSAEQTRQDGAVGVATIMTIVGSMLTFQLQA